MKQLIALFFLITPSLFAQKWNELNFKSIGYIFTATSELDGGQVDDSGINRKYGAVNLFDGNYTTAWVDGVKGNGIGESIYVAIPNDCRTINIFAGYGKSPTIYNSNNRVKRIKLSCYIGINPEGYVTELDFYGYLMQRFPAEYFIDLKDVAELQTFIFPFSLQELKIFQEEVTNNYHKDYKLTIKQNHFILQLEIVDVYKGLKWDDACISELFFSDIYVSDNRKIKFPEVKKIYVDKEKGSRIMIDTQEKKQIVIVNDPAWIFQIVEVSSDNNWATVIRMPANTGKGRVETEYLLIDTRLGKVINVDIEKTWGKSIFGPFFLHSEDGTTILEHSQGSIRLL